MVDLTTARRFRALFTGMEKAYGCYDSIGKTVRDDGKLEGDAVTVRKPVTDELYQQHIEGKRSLGIIPIRDSDNCACFGAIDVDTYDGLNHADVAQQIAKQGLPLVPCRSKSGGIHVYLFAASPVPAAKMQSKLRDISARLGFGGSECFPKQTKTDEKRLGSWINLPYYGGDETMRYAISQPHGDAMSLAQFLDTAERLKQAPEWFDKPLATGPGTLPDGPPCLQHLTALGFPQGSRDRGLFNVAVYCRKTGADNWKDMVVELNQKHFVPPLSHDEVSKTIRSVESKDYGYQCSESLLAPHCDQPLCRKRKYGIRGGASALPALGSLVKLTTTPPTWYLEVEGQTLELTTTELLSPLDFQKRCAEQLDGVEVPHCSRARWVAHVNPAIKTATKVPAPEDASPSFIFREYLEQFCTGRTQAQCEEEIVLGKPWTDGGKTRFRLMDFLRYLENKRVKDFNVKSAVNILRSMNAGHEGRHIAGKFVNLWWVPEFARRQDPVPVTRGIDDEGGQF